MGGKVRFSFLGFFHEARDAIDTELGDVVVCGLHDGGHDVGGIEDQAGFIGSSGDGVECHGVHSDVGRSADDGVVGDACADQESGGGDGVIAPVVSVEHGGAAKFAEDDDGGVIEDGAFVEFVWRFGEIVDEDIECLEAFALSVGLCGGPLGTVCIESTRETDADTLRDVVFEGLEDHRGFLSSGATAVVAVAESDHLGVVAVEVEEADEVACDEFACFFLHGVEKRKQAFFVVFIGITEVLFSAVFFDDLAEDFVGRTRPIAEGGEKVVDARHAQACCKGGIASVVAFETDNEVGDGGFCALLGDDARRDRRTRGVESAWGLSCDEEAASDFVGDGSRGHPANDAHLVKVPCHRFHRRAKVDIGTFGLDGFFFVHIAEAFVTELDLGFSHPRIGEFAGVAWVQRDQKVPSTAEIAKDEVAQGRCGGIGLEFGHLDVREGERTCAESKRFEEHASAVRHDRLLLFVSESCSVVCVSRLVRPVVGEQSEGFTSHPGLGDQ